MVEQGKQSSEFTDVSQEMTTKLVAKHLGNHGFKKEHLKPISDSDKAQLKSLVEDLKDKLENLVQSQDVTNEPVTEETNSKKKRKTK